MYLSICRYRVQELTVDQARDGHMCSQQMRDTQAGAQMRTAHSQDRQPGRAHVRAGHDEHTQKGARRAQKAARKRLKGKG